MRKAIAVARKELRQIAHAAKGYLLALSRLVAAGGVDRFRVVLVAVAANGVEVFTVAGDDGFLHVNDRFGVYDVSAKNPAPRPPAPGTAP